MTEIENKSTMEKIRLGMQLRDREPTEHARGAQGPTLSTENRMGKKEREGERERGGRRAKETKK